MRILHIITGLNNGGAEAVLYRLISRDTKNTHTVVSLTGNGKYSSLLCDLNVTVYTLNMPRGKITYLGVMKLWKIIKNDNTAIIQTWMYHADLLGGLLAILQKTPYIIWGIRNSDISTQTTSSSTRIVVYICALLSRIIPTKIISCSQQAADAHQKIGYIKKKFIVIPNGYNTSLFSPHHDFYSALYSELNLPRDITVLGMVGRFSPHKNHQNLIEALKIIKQNQISFHCLLIGNDMSHTNIELIKWIEQANLTNQISLLGQRNDIHKIMNILDIHILSSIGEAFPNVLAEAMACGIPCVTTDVGDAAMIVGDTGWIVPASDSQALADAIIRAIVEKESEPNIWLTRKQAARNRIIENFDIDRMVSAYNKVWQGI